METRREARAEQTAEKPPVSRSGQQRTLALVLGGVGALVAARAWRAARRIDFRDKSVVIAGGSRGLGLVLARELAAEGARLTLLARDADELERAREDLESRGARVTVAVCDIREREEVERTIAEVVRVHGGIDVLLNVAGVIQVGPVEHMTLSDFENAMATHFWGPLYTIRAALPHLRQSAAARIVNISSIGGKLAVPHLLPYSASKFALTGLSEGLRSELARDGIRVTTVCPGLMRTGSTYNAWFKGRHRQEFAWFHIADSLPGLSVDARRAARQIIESCRRGDAQLIISLPARVAVCVNAAFPNAVAGAMTLTNQVLPKPGGEAAAEARSGWQSVSRVAPSAITRLTDQPTIENNQAIANRV